MKNNIILFLLLISFTPKTFSQCSYTGSPLTQAGPNYIFCIDNPNTITTAIVNSGQYAVVKVVKGFSYTFSVGNVFTTSTENLTVFNALTNTLVSSAAFNSGASGTSVAWTSTLTGDIKIMLSRGACVNDNTIGGTLTLTLNSVGNTQDSQATFGVDQWVGHVYNWIGNPPPGGLSPSTPSATFPFTTANYVGYYNIPTENFTENFGGNTACFPVLSNGINATNIYTDKFAVRYRMRSSKVGCYLVNFNGDDGIRVYVDGVKVFDEWKQQAPTTYANVLLYLTGNSEIIFDYYENSGQNVANFTIAPFVSNPNTISQSAVNVCSGTTSLLNGNAYTYNGNTTNPSITYQWQSSTDNINFTNIPGITTEDYTPAAQTTTTSNIVIYYRRIVTASATNAGSCVYTSNVVKVTTSPGTPTSPTAISGVNLQCPALIGQVYSIPIVANANTYTWTVPAGWSITNGNGTTSITVTTGNSGQNGSISVTASNGCGTSAATTLAVTVSNSIAGTVSANQTICSGSTPVNLTLTGNNGTIQWQSSTDNVNFNAISGATAATLSGATIGTLTTTQYFRALVTRGTCTSVNSNIVTITVNPTTLAGVATSNQTICSGTSPNALTLTGNVGTIQWQSSTNNTTFTNIGGATSASLSSASMGVLTATRYYRAVVKSGVCAAINSNTITITVNPGSLGGTISTNQTICSGATPSTLTLSNSNGTIQWETSTDNSNFTTISGATTNTLTGATIGPLTATRYFRAVVTFGSCNPANSNTITIAVNPLTIAGTASANQTICNGASPLDISLTGNTGTIQWQSSTNNTTFTNIPGATSATLTSATMGILSATRYYRAVVKSGVCASLNSNTITVTVTSNPASNAGTASSNQTICAGSMPSNLILTGSIGSIQWQSSIDNSNFSNIVGATTATLTGTTIGSLTATRYYRAAVTNGVCASVNSNTITISVSPLSVAGTVSSNQTICYGTTPTDLTLNGNTGTIQWQSSTDNSNFSNIVGATTATLNDVTLGSLTVTSYYRAIVTSGVCSSINSNVITITVSPLTLAGTATSNQTICSGTTPTDISLNGYTGTIQWQSSIDNNNFNNIDGATSATLSGATIGSLTEVRYYRAVVTSGVCSSINSNTVTIAISPLTEAGTASSNETICSGTTPSSIILTGSTGAIQWQSSTDNINFNPIAGETATILNNTQIGNLNTTTYFQAKVISGSCSAAFSNTVSKIVGSTSVWNGTSWNVNPTGFTDLVFNGNYSSTNDLDGCTCTVNSGTVIINSENDMSLIGSVTVNSGSLTFENNSNLLQQLNVTNTGNITVKRNSTPLRRLDYTLWSTPVTGQNLLSFSPTTLSNRFYVYNTLTNLYNALSSPSTTTFTTGKGYLIRVPNTFSATTNTIYNGAFTGIPNNGNISFNLIDGGSDAFRFNATGNPYPSAITLDNFINSNLSNIEGTLWFWRKINDDTNPVSYSTCTTVGCTVNNSHSYFDENLISVGQGFLVKAKAGASTVDFTNAIRSSENVDQFFRTGNENRYWLELKNSSNKSFGEKLIAYVDGATLGYDDGKDGLYLNDSPTALTSVIDANELIIQARPAFDVSDVLPLNFKTNVADSYSISLIIKEGVFNSQEIILKDNLLSTFQDLQLSPYIFTSDTGNFTNRFEIVYQSNLSNNTNVFQNKIVIFTNEAISIKSTRENIDEVMIYDLSGRLIFQKNNCNTLEETIKLKKINQVLLVKVKTNDGVITTEKVIF